ncbi:hypothetical protein I6F11_27325 [Ensifer sp. NBAIM29]|nr:hypothetical protein [Ensifer sp. NBAIM29]
MAQQIVAIVEPMDAFVVEEGFDDIVENWDKALPQDEGRFIGGAELASFAALVVPFLLGFFGDVAKDVIKDQAKRATAALITKLLAKKSTVDEAGRLKSEIDAAITKSGFSAEQKTALANGFGTLFATVGPAK